MNDLKPMMLDMETMMNEIANVQSSKIVYNDQGEIEEIHIVSDDVRSPKQISRDIQSLLLAKCDLKVDYKKISVAQVNSKERAIDKVRFSIGAIGYCMVDSFVEIKIILRKGDQEYESTIKGPISKNNIYRLVVQATLECVHSFLGRRDVFIVEDIEKFTLAKHKVINIAIAYTGNHEEELLIGAAILRKDDYEAVVKGTLDAVNRKIV